MAETKIDIKKVNDLQEKLNMLILESNSIVAKLKNNWNTKNFIYDPDSSPKAWEYYLSYYNIFEKTQSQLKTFCTPLLEDDNTIVSFWIYDNCLYKRINGTFLYFKDKKLILTTPNLIVGKNIGLAGDCCFNFNEKKIENYCKIIETDINEVSSNNEETLRLLLLLLNIMHHSPLNFALMPTNGGKYNSFNNKKANIFDRNDRLDSFLCYLEKDFNNDKRPKALKEFLEAIGSFENYREVFYPEIHENEALKKKITETGDMKIEDCNSLLAYIDTAISFWKAKLDYFNNSHKES